MLTAIRHFTTRGIMWPILHINHNNFISEISSWSINITQRQLTTSPTNFFFGINLYPSPSENNQSLANDFSTFFCDKITKVMEALEPTSPDQIDTLYIKLEFQTELWLDVFKEVTLDYVVNLIKSIQTNHVN